MNEIFLYAELTFYVREHDFLIEKVLAIRCNVIAIMTISEVIISFKCTTSNAYLFKLDLKYVLKEI